MTKKFTFLALFLLTNTFVIGQNNYSAKPISQINTIEETLYVHCNTTTLLTGETLLFKIYSLNPLQKKLSPISKIGYVELLDEGNKSVLKQKIALKNGTGQGDFFISTTLKTGNYKLIAYTNWSLNKAEKGISKTAIYLINPFESNTPGEITKSISSETESLSPSNVHKKGETTALNNSLIAVKTDKEKYSLREKVSLTISAISKKKLDGSFSVSVRKTDSLPTPETLSSIDFINAFPGMNNSNTEKSRFLPELRGENISGKIVGKDSAKDLKDKTVALSLPGKSFGFKVAKTEDNGKFNFILDRHPGTTEAIIQVMEKDRNDYEIVLDKTNTPELKTADVSALLQLHPKNKKEIENRSIANQIENNYYQKKKDSLANPLKNVSFFHPLEKEYVLDDYTRFPSLKETIIEVLYEVSYKKENDTYSLLIKDFSAQGEAYGEALVLVDGLLIQNVNELFEYDMQNIYKVSFVNQGYVYGPKVFNGVINFVTKKQDYKTKTSGTFIKDVTIERPQTEKKYFSPDYSLSNDERIPDFRYQLFWLPEAGLTENESRLFFYTSDVKGRFEISIEGFTNQGEAVSIKEYLTVE